MNNKNESLNTIDPLTAAELEQVGRLVQLLEQHPAMKLELLWSFLQDYRRNQDVDAAIAFAANEWDVL